MSASGELQKGGIVGNPESRLGLTVCCSLVLFYDTGRPHSAISGILKEG